jgi:hypothetical protein
MPFTPEAIAAVHRHSGGSPRVINTLCDNALFEAFLARAESISGELVDQIGLNLGLARPNGAEPAVSAQDTHIARSPAVLVKASSPKIDLAEIDRYLEGLGKL